MALNVFELFGKITIDSSGAKSGLDSAVGHAQKAESKLGATLKKIGTAVVAAFSVKAVVDFGKQCTQVYATIAAEESAFAQIMGDYAGTAQQKLDAVAKQTGVVSTRLTSSMTSLTAKFKGLGYNVADATTLAADGLLIASDAAAFWDMSLEESMSHLNSFINGSYEGGEAIGLFANDTQMAAYAIEQGIVKDAKAWAKLDEAQRQATRLQYAMNMQKMSGAVGQAAKESEQYANAMANLKEHWRQFQGIIGKPIMEKLVLPALKKLNEIMPNLNKAVQDSIAWMDTGINKLKTYFADVSAGKVKFGIDLPDWATLTKNISNGWNNTVWPAIQSFFKVAFGIDLPKWVTIKRNISNGWNKTVWPAIQNFFKVAFGVDLPDWKTLKQNISDGWNKTVWPEVQNFFKVAFGITLPSWEQLKTKISDGWNKTVWPSIQGFFKSPMEVILPAWETLKTDIKTGWENTVWPAVKDFFTKPLDITLPTWDTLKSDIVTGWNNTVWPAIQDFFTKKFEITLPSWETLLSDISSGWNDTIWPGIKDAFKKAFEVAMPAWENLKNLIVDGWTNIIVPGIVDFFKTTFKVAMPAWENVKSEIATAWTTVIMPGINEAFKTAFEVVMPAWEGLKEIIAAGWSDIIWPGIQDAFKTAFNVDLPDWATITSAISAGWNDVIWPGIQGFFKSTFGIKLPSWASVANDIRNWWKKVVSSVGSLTMNAGINLTRREQVGTTYHTQAAQVGQQQSQQVTEATGSSFLGGLANILNQSFVSNPDAPWLPGHATGLDYVPYDNYLARLHKGEAVLTSSEADVWRNGGGTGRVEAALTQMSDILRVIAQNTGADKQVVLDTGAVVGQLAPGIDAQLGMYASRKGRRN